MSKNSEYDSIDDLLLDLDNELLDIANNELDNKIKKVYKKEAESMYSKYTPKSNLNRSRYRRGESGSFADEKHFKSDVSSDRSSITYELHNERSTDCNCEYCRTHNNPNIDDFIELGIAGQSRYMKRPVSKDTERRLEEELTVEKTLEVQLKRRGWGVE